MNTSVFGYFKQLLKQNLAIITVVTVLGGFLFLPLSSTPSTHEFFEYTSSDMGYVTKYYYGDDIPETALPGFETNFGISVAFITMFGLIAPICSFWTFKKKHNLDVIYSLPLGKRRIALAHYLLGLIMTLIPAVLMFLLELVIIIAHGALPLINIGWLVFYFLMLLLAGWLFYSMNVFVFNEANTIIDGIVFIIGWNMVFGFAYSTLFGMELFKDMAFPMGYILELFSRIEGALETTAYPLSFIFKFETAVAMSAFWIVLGVLSVILFFVRSNKKKSEQIGGISDSFFGYNLLIPLYIIPVILESYIGYRFSDFIGILAVLACAFAGYAAFRRSLKFKASDYCALGGMVLLCVLVAINNSFLI